MKRYERAAPQAASLWELLANEQLKGTLQRLLTRKALRDTPALTLAGAELLGEGTSRLVPGCVLCACQTRAWLELVPTLRTLPDKVR